jgi:thioesterase domain-containing protein/acyl carrier protein
VQAGLSGDILIRRAPKRLFPLVVTRKRPFQRRCCCIRTANRVGEILVLPKGQILDSQYGWGGGRVSEVGQQLVMRPSHDLRVGPESASQAYPASLAQQRLWFLNELQAPTSAYNVNIGLWFYGALDLEALHVSIQQIVNRHETLRTTFALQKGELVQLVREEEYVALPLTDFSALEEPYPPAYEFAKREVAEPFALGKGPLFRTKILRIGPEEHVLLCTMHHTVTDAWSMQLFTKELAALYEAITNQRQPIVPELAIQYGDFAEWQRQLLDTDLVGKQLAYWKSTLDAVPALLRLPTDYPRPAEQTLQGLSHAFPVPNELMSDVLSLAARKQITTFMLLLASFKVLLYRYSGQPDVCVGVPVAGRTRLETEPLIGFFVDTLVFRDKLSGNPRFSDLLAQVRETTLGALANTDVPFEKLVEVLRPGRTLSYNPIFQVMFSVIKSAIRSHAFGNVVAYPYVVDACTSILDLSATFIEDSDGKWWLQIDFDTGLFKMSRIERLFEDYMDLLRQITARPQVRIDDLTILHTTELGSSIAHRPNEILTVPTPMVQVELSEVEVTPTGHERVRQSGVNGKRSALMSTEFGVGKSYEKLMPRDEIEHGLAEIWKEILGENHIGVRDSFFDRGGHSLLAARLFMRIQETFGASLPVATLFHEPTIEHLAKQLRHRHPVPNSCLEPLNSGGTRPPLFMGGSNPRYMEISRRLGADQPAYKMDLYALAERRVTAGLEPYTSLEEYAAEFLREIRSIQPTGPYFLSGGCDGGILSLEIAHQIQASGEQVGSLVLWETPRTGFFERDWFGTALHVTFRSLQALVSGDLRALTIRKDTHDPLSDEEARHLYIYNSYWAAIRRYSPPNYLGAITMIRAQKQYRVYKDVTFGWNRIATQGIEVHSVPGDHYSYFTDFFSEFIRVLAGILERAQTPQADTLGACIQNSPQEHPSSLLAS